MIEQKDGRVAGSIDRARVAELLAGTGDEEMKAYYREILGDTEEGRAVDEPAETESETEDDPVVDVDLDELRANAEALGVKVDGRWGVDRLREEIAANEGKSEGEV